MALNTSQAANLSKEDKAPRLYEESPKVDQLLDVISFAAVDGYALDIVNVSEYNMPAAYFVASGGYLYDTQAVPNAPVRYPIKRIAGDVIVNSLVQDVYSDLNIQAKVQIDAKTRASRYILGEKLIKGNTGSAPEEFNGLDNLVTWGQRVNASGGLWSGGPLLLTDVDWLVYMMIKAGYGMPDVLVCNTTARQKYLERCYTDSITPHFVQTPWFEDPVLSHNGIPILISDHITNDYTAGTNTNTTRMWGIVLGWSRGLTCIYPARAGEFLVKAERILQQGTDQEKYRVTWNVGLALFAETAIALLEGIDTA